MATEKEISDSRPDEKTAKGWQDYWVKEISDAQKQLREFRKQGDRAVHEYRDSQKLKKDAVKLNLFNANINTMKAMMYGQLPTVDVGRKFSDKDDDVARVAALLLQRLLDQDLEVNGEEYDTVIRSVLEDRLIPGLGCAVVRYDSSIAKRKVIDSETEEESEEEYLEWEDAEVNYHYWGDVCWSWCRNWSEMRWIGFRSYLTKEAAIERFGAETARQLQYKKNDPEASDQDTGDDFEADFIHTAAIWEIWDKESGKVFWFQKGQHFILDSDDDPLGLEGFFPCPPFFVANITSSHYMPTSDWWIAKDLYIEINRIEGRIATITEAVRVTGVYDKQHSSLQRMLQEAATDNQLIPVDNWAMLAEKGGLKGTIDWFPVGEVAGVLRELVAQRDDQIALLYQVTGMSDILRGAASQSTVSATEQELKAKFSSIRIQALQDSFAKFVSDLMQLKAELICKHYEPETILEQANAQNMIAADRKYLPAAIELLKSPKQMYFRVSIKPESVAMVDFAKKQQERTEFIQALGFFMQSAAPLVQESPETSPYLLELLMWGLGGFKGSEEIEGVLDEAIDKLKQNPPKKQQDPKQMAEMAKVQGQMQAQAQKHQNEMEKQEMQRQHEAQKHQFQMRELIAQFQADMTKLQSELDSALAQIGAKTDGAVTEQAAQTQGKLVETEAQTVAKLETIDAQVRARPQDSETDSSG